MASLCEQVKILFDRLQPLTERFLLEYEKVKNEGDRALVKKLKAEPETIYGELDKKINVPDYYLRWLDSVERKDNYHVIETLLWDSKKRCMHFRYCLTTG